MTQKQLIGIAAGVVVVGVVSLFVYTQFVQPVPTASLSSDASSAAQQKTASPSGEGVATAKAVVIPETIDGISASIESETTADLSALDAEESGAVSDIETDSQSVNNLGTSYDENNL